MTDRSRVISAVPTVITAACDSPGFAVTAEWLQSELGINKSALRKMVIKVCVYPHTACTST